MIMQLHRTEQHASSVTDYVRDTFPGCVFEAAVSRDCTGKAPCIFSSAVLRICRVVLREITHSFGAAAGHAIQEAFPCRYDKFQIVEHGGEGVTTFAESA